ncbi:MAG: hypothetical protein CM15mV1_1990 [uncultured marine virus]|nr:MAG: hypothetical protein CM15mV1_1990 [uncultured marine virus]
MKENMMKNQVFVSIPMNKIYATCIIGAIAWCAAAQACSLPLDGSPANCPPFDGDFDDIKLPREELRGEIDIYEPMHWHSINQMFIRNARRTQIEKNMTLPSDSINSALENFWEQENGSNGATESEELL